MIGCCRHVQFTRPDKDDFGVALSPEGQLMVKLLVDSVSKAMAARVRSIAEALHQHYQVRPGTRTQQPESSSKLALAVPLSPCLGYHLT